jgi:hypothetical protein
VPKLADATMFWIQYFGMIMPHHCISVLILREEVAWRMAEKAVQVKLMLFI